MGQSADSRSGDVGTIAAANQVLSGQSRKGRIGRLWPFLGPAVIASVAYMDPGNFATTIQGGAKFGYTLLWVVVASNVMAVLIQTLSAKLGIATGQNLAELCRAQFSPPVVWVMWVLMELVAMATDLAEFLGAALGFNLLFGIPLWIAGIITAITTFFILAAERRGFRRLEAIIAVFVGAIALAYLVEVILARPRWTEIAYHAVTPQFSGSESVLLATGILGATVMPHVIFLHSALLQGRIVTRDPVRMRRLFRYEVTDVTIAMTVAGLVNAAMLVMAAATFHRGGFNEVGSIEQAYRTLEPLLGRAASVAFGVALLAAGLSSSAVGTMSGQIIMQGFLHRSIPLWIRRTVTMAPSLVVIFVGFDPTRTLVVSQVVLSFGIPFAVVPLVMFTRQRETMGVLVNRRPTTVLAAFFALLVIALNGYLLYETLFG